MNDGFTESVKNYVNLADTDNESRVVNPLENSIELKSNTIVSGWLKAIIFDLGNVLLDFDHRIAARKISRFIPSPSRPYAQEGGLGAKAEFTDSIEQEIFNLFFDSELTGFFEEGKISPFQFFSKAKEILNFKLDYNEFVPIWNEIFFFTETNNAVYNLARELRKRYKVALLSNINILHFEYIKKTFPILDVFHNIITSFQLGLKKPEPAIYRKTLEILGVFPTDVLYIDDRPELIERARGLGIKGFVFRGIEQLEKDLLDTLTNIDQ